MSISNFPGGVVSKTTTAPTGPYDNGVASGVWTIAQAAFWTKQGLWPIAGNSPPSALFAGQPANIDRINISTLGNATSFGSLAGTLQAAGGCGSTTRGLLMGGNSSVYGVSNVIEFVTFATTGSTTDFGDLTV